MKHPEQEIQRAVFAHLRGHRAMPGSVAFHCPNGGNRSIIEGAIFKGMGVMPGIPDILIVHHGKVYALELKSERGKLSPSQRLCLEALATAGAETAVAHSLDEALVILEYWGVLRRDCSRRITVNAATAGGS